MIEAPQKSVRIRTLRSLAFGFFALCVGIAGWSWILHSPDRDEIPGPLRSVHEFNYRIWKTYFGTHRMSQLPAPPPVGRPPRVNGDLGLNTPIDFAHWKLSLLSSPLYQESKPLRLNLTQLKSLPTVSTSTEFRCIEGWSEMFAYTGVRFSEFLTHFGVGTRDGTPPDPIHHPESLYRYVGFETPDREYYVSIDMESMLHPQTLLSWEMNGRPLSSENGAPLRLIIPVKYGIKSLKRIGRIFFSDTRPPDYWAEHGYDWYSGL